jgi:hypothetical protein
MVNENDQVTDLVSDFTSQLISKGFRVEYIIEAFVVADYSLAKQNELEDHLLDVMDHFSEKLDTD